MKGIKKLIKALDLTCSEMGNCNGCDECDLRCNWPDIYNLIEEVIKENKGEDKK